MVWVSAQMIRARAERDRAQNEYKRYAADPEAFAEVAVENRMQAALSAQAALGSSWMARSSSTRAAP